jgi:dTDP-glucose pyrophosphorylase
LTPSAPGIDRGGHVLKIISLFAGSTLDQQITYIEQPFPDGSAEAYLLAAADAQTAGGTVFGYRVADLERYGIVAMVADDTVTQTIEKPEISPQTTPVLACISSMEQRRYVRTVLRHLSAANWKSHRCRKAIWMMEC